MYGEETFGVWQRYVYQGSGRSEDDIWGVKEQKVENELVDKILDFIIQSVFELGGDIWCHKKYFVKVTGDLKMAHEGVLFRDTK